MLNRASSIIIAIVIGCLALFMALKIGLFILKVIFGLIALAALGGRSGGCCLGSSRSLTAQLAV